LTFEEIKGLIFARVQLENMELGRGRGVGVGLTKLKNHPSSAY